MWFKFQVVVVTMFFPLAVLLDVVLWNLLFGSMYGYVSPKQSWKNLKKQIREDQIKCGFRKGS